MQVALTPGPSRTQRRRRPRGWCGVRPVRLNAVSRGPSRKRCCWNRRRRSRVSNKSRLRRREQPSWCVRRSGVAAIGDKICDAYDRAEVVDAEVLQRDMYSEVLFEVEHQLDELQGIHEACLDKICGG